MTSFSDLTQAASAARERHASVIFLSSTSSIVQLGLKSIRQQCYQSDIQSASNHCNSLSLHEFAAQPFAVVTEAVSGGQA